MTVSKPAAIAGDRAPVTLRIGEWCVSPAANELTRDGESVRLEPKVMELLVFLAERTGQVVSREALLAALWEDVVVGDAALSQAVIKLRKALCDSARSPAYIETISKRGYRLVARVDGVPGVAADTVETRPAAETEPPVTGRPGIRRAWVLAGTLLAIVILGVTIALYQAAESDGDALLAQLPSIDERLAQRSTALPTVAILPFEALSQDRDQVYLAAGMTADLTTDLSQLSGLRVVSVSGPASAVHDGAKAVRYVVSGIVQLASGKLKVNVRLVDNQSRQQLWAERYERPLGDPFALNEDIVARLLEALSVQIGDAERARLARRYTRNLDAYSYFLRGQAAYFARHQGENSTARDRYRKAIELDPTFARAYAGLALTHAADYRNQWAADGPQALARAAELAETAVRIDPQLPEAYGVLAVVSTHQGKHQQAITYLTRAVTLDPLYADGYALLGSVYTYMGQPAKAVPLLRTALRLNPDGTTLYFRVLGRAYLLQGDTEQALINLREALSRNAADVDARVFMTAALLAAGDIEAAKWEAEEIRALRPGFATRNWIEMRPMTGAGQKEQLQSLLAQVGL